MPPCRELYHGQRKPRICGNQAGFLGFRVARLGRLGFVLAVLCIGPNFTATSTAFSKRSRASGRKLSDLAGAFAMKINPDDEEADYATFGKIILLWGHIEASLVGIILALRSPRHKLPDRGGVPLQFHTKRKHILEGYNDIPKMASIRKRAKSEIEALVLLHEKRSIIVHGYYQGFTGHGYYLFGAYESRPNQTKRWRSYQFTQAELEALAGDLAKHNVIMRDLATETLRVLAYGKSQKAKSPRAPRMPPRNP